ncbi:MAG TPA: MFS transporter [Erwinia persicina]|uniref:Bcr/CflA family efflux transporter n=1 Tax=Erwinia persicina TaxID=55211 RepID=A0A3S7S3W8_9GAMM|nr:multidrug effflux MFS transporter [Erwinia persicina]AXU95393.1 MFS transporter [Erwinia persicina]MBC3944308.1 multidrug effflux MFS transporter [Erwinia persicina]MBD8105334.1 multidrug effflux MFS transporter [Erwinia persicina]MBD8165931.1 multidrug effflux MFS transporter [Erwinia persicina]MBD8208480.1 multidrug effflux MFS transporter [Erwinia persicina]
MTPVHSRRLGYAITLGLLAALGPLCIDLYLPALPELARDLNTPTATAQLSLTAGLLGLGLGQLFFGPLSDKYGRIRPLLLSLVLLLIASVGCALAQDIHQLLLARLFEGLSGAGGAVLSRAIARDMYSGHELTRFFALLMLVNGLAPIAAPVMGGALMAFLDWRGLFMVIALIALMLFILARVKLHETLPVARRSQGSIFSAWAALGQVIMHRPFMGFCLTQGFMMSGMFAYIGASPFVLQQIYQLSPQAFSFCFAANGVGLIIASQVSARLCPLWGEYRVLKGGLTLALISSSSLLLAGLTAAPLPLVLVALFFTVASNGVISVTASSLAMQSQGHRAGSASAVIGVTMFTLGGISVPVTGIGGTSVLTMTATIFGCYMLAILMFTVLAQKPKKE